MPIASERFDAAIVGGGPAGASAALHLARAGARVVLLDRERHPRYKTCGGGVVRRAMEEMPVDLGEAKGLRLHAAEMHDAEAGVCVRVERAEPLLWMTMRADMDGALVAAAAEAGAKLRAPCAVGDVTVGARSVRLATDHGTIEAGFALLADGALSRTARAAGWPDPPLCVPALEWELEVDGRDRERFAGAARFDFGRPPRGYAWVFPKADHLSVGVLAMGRGRFDLRGALEGHLDALGLGGRRADEHGFVIPVRPRPGAPARGPVLLLGDALGLADPISAEGIGPALTSGRLAARALLDSGFDPKRAAPLYGELLDRVLLRDLAAARPLAGVLYGRPRWRVRLFRRFARPFCEAMVAQIAGERTYRELLLRPTSWLRLLAGGLAARPARVGAG